MAVGFGEAGSEIIAENMRNGGRLNPMIPGRKMVAVFGFCDIRQFTDTTEVLQEGIMEFVNQIARIVHLEVARHGGSANKNIGDAFLLVWKFPDWVRPQDVDRCVRAGAPVAGDDVSGAADRALASFVLTIAELRRSSRLAVYRRNPELCKRIHDFRVRMGFGLHVGWAIEGAIGSEFKARLSSLFPPACLREDSLPPLAPAAAAGSYHATAPSPPPAAAGRPQVDASYLSPNVNMASRLEAATKQFGVPILLSSDFVVRTPPRRSPAPPRAATSLRKQGYSAPESPSSRACGGRLTPPGPPSPRTPQSLLSPTVAAQCRQIDRVTVKGSTVPVGLYTFDCEPEMIADPAAGWDAYASGVISGKRAVRRGGFFAAPRCPVLLLASPCRSWTAPPGEQGAFLRRNPTVRVRAPVSACPPGGVRGRVPGPPGHPAAPQRRRAVHGNVQEGLRGARCFMISDFHD